MVYRRLEVAECWVLGFRASAVADTEAEMCDTIVWLGVQRLGVGVNSLVHAAGPRPQHQGVAQVPPRLVRSTLLGEAAQGRQIGPGRLPGSLGR